MTRWRNIAAAASLLLTAGGALAQPVRSPVAIPSTVPAPALPTADALFTDPAHALAGWVHYLAFDLFVGAWITRTARDEGIPHLLILPCLVLAFLFGPAGFLAFVALRASFTLRARMTGVAA